MEIFTTTTVAAARPWITQGPRIGLFGHSLARGLVNAPADNGVVQTANARMSVRTIRFAVKQTHPPREVLR